MSVSASSVRPSEELVPGIPPPENKVFYPALDGFRATAALWVFFYHYFSGGHVPQVLQFGWAGVDMFFVLSGFLITGILFDTRNDPHRLRNFYVRRSLRIFPLYYGILAVLLLTTPFLHWQWHRNMIFWPLYLGNYVTGNIYLFSSALHHQIEIGQFWSLCVEEQFYLVWPFVVYFVRDRMRLRNLCLWVVVLVPLIRLVASFVLPAALVQSRILYFAMPFRVDGLLLGGAMALMLRGPEAERLRRIPVALLSTSCALFLLCWIFAVRVLHQPVGMHVPTPWVETIGFTLIDLMAAALLILALRPGNPVYRLFSVRALRRIGQMSYGFYVFHCLPYDFYVAAAARICGGHKSLEAIVGGCIAMVGTLTISYLSFRFFEAPFLRLKDRFTIHTPRPVAV